MAKENIPSPKWSGLRYPVKESRRRNTNRNSQSNLKDFNEFFDTVQESGAISIVVICILYL